MGWEGRAYGELARPPEPLDDAQVVEGHGSEQHLSGIRKACLRFSVSFRC